jgi:two-component system sensor histidine kinase/response regulator
MKKKILIIDDREENIYSFCQTLERIDSVEIDTCKSGPEALEKLLHQRYATILLDVQMPGMNGFEVARYIRQNPKTEDIPIILISASHTDEIDHIKGYESGACDYITKPVNPMLLIKKVEHSLSKSRSREQILLQRAMKAEQEIEARKDSEALKKVSEAEAAIERFQDGLEDIAYLISRDIQMPVMTMKHKIREMQKMLQSGQPATDLWQPLYRLYKQINSMDTMVFAVQNYCKVRSRELEKQSISLSDVIRQAWEDITLNVAASEARLEYGELPNVDADPVQLRMLMLHLLGNAVERSNEDSPVVRILSRQQEGFTRIEIEDSGEVISQSSRDSMFQIHKPVETSMPGAGFTLYLCKNIVEAHGGKIGVEDTTSGRGNLFWFTLQSATSAA